MAIMTTGVHGLGTLRAVGHRVCFLDRQGIHIGPNRDRWPWQNAANGCHNTRLGNATLMRNLSQLRTDKGRRVVFLKA